MKKSLKTALCFILIAVMLNVNILCFADSPENDTVYVSLGDSIAGGIGLPANPLRGPDQENKLLVYCCKTEGAYPALVAQQLGVRDENFYQLACAGMRTVELRRCLDESYVMPNNEANNFQGNELQEWVLSRFDYVDIIKKADIVTLNMCANDIATCALFAVRRAMAASGVSDVLMNRLTVDNMAKSDFIGALAVLMDYASKIGYYGRIAAAAIEGITNGYAMWAENWEAICGRIYELNPDVKLICLGMYNPFASMKLTEKSLLGIGSAIDGVVSAVNSWAAAGSAYADRYTYVSIMGIESMMEAQGMTFLDDEFLSDFELGVHPSVKGQQQIASRVVSAAGQKGIFTDPLRLIENLGVKGAKKTVASISIKATKVISGIAALFR